MQAQLERIIIFNFKSFKGKVIIGPIKPFTAIIGANGSGKSNIMDALSFVMGEKSRSLRVKTFNELIYGASKGIPMTHRAYVTAVFTFEDNSIKTFTRGVSHTCCEYKIDEQIVTAQEYIFELRKLNLNVNAKNFLIFQGAIDSTIMKTPKEYAHIFEEISNSIELKEEYERLKNKILKAENEIQYLQKRKKDLFIKKKYALSEKEEAEKYKKLQKQYLKKNTELYLFELFHIQKDVQDLEVILKAADLKINEYEREKEILLDVLKERKDQLKIALKDQENIEQDLAKVENDVKKEEAYFVEIKEKVLYWEQKVNSTNSMLLDAHKSNKSHIKTIKELKNELATIEHTKSMFEEDTAIQLSSQNSSIELNNIQVQEYFRLKQVAEAQCLANVKKCNFLKHEQNEIQNELDNENRKIYELEATLNKKIILKDETEKWIKNIDQCMTQTQNILTEKTNMKYNLENMITQQRKDIESIQLELQYVSEQLDDAKLDKFTTLRLNKEAETVKTLQTHFSGVYGRLYNLCKPIHSRYNVAMTKVLGKYCNSIVVSTNNVAMQCIKYLREQQIGCETFLPVKDLKVEPLRELRFTQLKNVKFLYDVLKFEPAEINNAILFATKNTFVCETSEDARTLAYEIDLHRRYNCVALDGSYYTKSGIISGGEVQCLKSAQIWDQQNIVQLKAKKIMLTEKLNEKIKISQIESEINELNIQIQSLKHRLHYCKRDLNAAENKRFTLQNEIENIQSELELVNNNVASIKKVMEEKSQNIQNIEKSIMDIEDLVFEDFCKNIGITDVRQYEQRNIRLYQEQRRRQLELEEQCGRIQNLLDFEMSRDTESLVLKIKKSLKAAKEKLEKARQDEALCTISIERQANELNKLQSMYDEVKVNVTERTKNVSECRHQIGVIAKSIINVQKECIIIITKINKKKAKCQAILTSTKIENVTIPLLHEDVTNDLQNVRLSSGSFSTSDTSEIQNMEILSHIDFSMLSEDIKTRVEEDINNSRNKLVQEIKQLQNEMVTIKNPNFKANREVQYTAEKLEEINHTYKDIRDEANITKREFEVVKQERYDRFTYCLEYINTELDSIYKCLLKDQSAQAILLADNCEEPYLGGINYSCIMAGKRFHSFPNLSGGEKTLAALAFLFAIHRPAPFFVLDEIDAALDNTNIRNVVRFVRSKMKQLQFIIISLKQELYSHADALIGICSDNNGEYPESLVYTLSLKKYPS